MQYFGASLLMLLGLASSLQCTEVNGGHNTWSNRPRVRLEVHPRIEEWSHNPGKKLILHKKNEPLNMTCNVVYQNGGKEDNAPFDYIVDWKVPRHIDNNLKIERGQSRNTAWIWFEQLAETEAGDYKCEAVPSKSSSDHATLWVSFHLIVEHTPRYCGSEWFVCRSKNCIMARYVCDGKQDCEDGEDESSAAGCGPDPCLGKVLCEDRCIPPEWCCDHRNCSGTFGLRPWPHETNEISYVQTAFYTVIGCAMAFMFIVTILVIAICKVQIKRAMNSRCSQQNRNPCRRPTVPLYDLDVYFNRTAEVNYPGGVSIMYNINSGVQFVGRPAEPPPYSEVVAEPPREGPPPPYVSCENLIVRQQNPQAIETNEPTAANNIPQSLTMEQSLKDEVVTPPDTDIRGSQSSTSGQRENSVPNVPGPQVAPHSSVPQVPSINNRDPNTAFIHGNNSYSRDTIDAPITSETSRNRSSPRSNFELEYVETDALLAENSNVGIQNPKTIVWKPYSRHALMKSRWLNNERNDKNPEKHWYRQRVEKPVKECSSRNREVSSLRDSENEGVFLDTDQQDSTPAESTTSGESDLTTGFPPFVNIDSTKVLDADERPSGSTSDAASVLIERNRRDPKLTDYKKNSEISNGASSKKMKSSRDDKSKNEASSRRSSQVATDKSFSRGIKRQSSLTSGEIRSKNLGESSASASTGTIDSANSRIDNDDGNSQIRESSLVLPLRESFIGVQRDS